MFRADNVAEDFPVFKQLGAKSNSKYKKPRRPSPPSEARPRKLPTGRRARSSPSPTTQSQCSAAVNQRETVASGQTREKSRIEFLIIYSHSIVAGGLPEIS